MSDTSAKPAPKPASAAPAAVAAPVKVAKAVTVSVEPVAKKPAPSAKVMPVDAKPKTLLVAKPTTPKAKDTTMNDTIKTITDKTQAMFSGADTSAKDAMAKGSKAIEEMNAFGKGNIEAIVESSKIAAKGMEAMGQDAATYAKTSFERATATMKQLSSVKSPTEFFKLQSDYVRTAFDAMVAEGSRSTEAMLKLAGEVAQPISNRMALAAEKVKIAA